jgi:hypothetical protein
MMPRYFFNLNFPEMDVIDPDGAESPDLEAAKSDAGEAIREIAAHHLEIGTPLTLDSISICDDGDNVVAKVGTREALSEVIVPVSLGTSSTGVH